MTVPDNHFVYHGGLTKMASFVKGFALQSNAKMTKCIVLLLQTQSLDVHNPLYAFPNYLISMEISVLINNALFCALTSNSSAKDQPSN